MGLIEPDPGHVVAEEVEALAALDRQRGYLERGGVDPLLGPIDRHQPQHVIRIGDLRRIDIGRGLANIVDHASASHTASERSLCARCEESIASESFISALSLPAIRPGSSLAASAVRKPVAIEAAICCGGDS